MFGGLFEIIIFAAVTVFFVIKLMAALGKEDKDGSVNRHGNKLKNIVTPAEGVRTIDPIILSRKINDQEKLVEKYGKEMAERIKAIQKKEESFSPEEFLRGAEKAFEYIVMNFSHGKKGELKPLLSKEIYETFCKEIDKNKANNSKQNTIIVSLGKPSFSAINLKSDTANITLDIVSEQINYLSDKDNKVISGDSEQIDKIEDIWTFSRDLKSSNPNWVLIKTDSI